MVTKLLIATHNPGKAAEYQLLLSDMPLYIVSLSDQGIDYEAPETGATFAENACEKAVAYARLTGLLTWADDSGLEVDALDGRPGVHSARYGGDDLRDAERYSLLLRELADRSNNRTARFRCAVCLAKPNGETITVEDSVEGLIIDKPVGEHGFGYDPIFFLPEQQMTMAQLPPALKNEISHRGKAARAAKIVIKQLLGSATGEK